MIRISPLQPTEASGSVKMTLDAIQQKVGFVPNFYATIAKAPPVLDAYLKVSDALSHGGFSAGLREKIAIAVAQENGCAYCLSAHTAVGKMMGLDQAALDASRRGDAETQFESAVLKLAIKLVQTRGNLIHSDLVDARQGGLADRDILETVAHVAMNIFSNYLNHVADPEIDFPQVDPKIFG